MMNNEFEELRSGLSIIELLEAKGFQLDKHAGLKTPVFRHPDGDKIVIVNPNNAANQGYWNPHDDKDKGHIYHFIKNRLNTLFRNDANENNEYKNILAVMRKYSHSASIIDKAHTSSQQTIHQYKQQDFHVPILDNLHDTAYLEKRGIHKNTYQSPLFNNRIFNKRYPFFSNTVFPLFNADAEVVGLDERNSNVKFFASGSNKSTGVWMSEPPDKIDHVLLFESPVDALSYYQLKGAMPANALLVSFCGSIGEGQLDTVKKVIHQKSEENQKVNIIIGTDNDLAGNNYADKIKSFFKDKEKYALYRAKPVSKDFNEDLQNLQMNEKKTKVETPQQRVTPLMLIPNMEREKTFGYKR